MSTSIVLSVVSDDHPGIVEKLSELLADHGGNWTESSMLTLAGKFAGILLASVPENEVDALIDRLRGLEQQGMQVVAQRTARADHTAIILSLEAVFAALAGWMILSETLSVRGLVGCAVMLAGMIVSQLRKDDAPETVGAN